MDNRTYNAVRSLMNAREEAAFDRLKNNAAYKQVCKQQEGSAALIEELYKRFDKEERDSIRNHYEGELHKTNFEINESYLQGLRDCFHLVSFLNGKEVQL